MIIDRVYEKSKAEDDRGKALLFQYKLFMRYGFENSMWMESEEAGEEPQKGMEARADGKPGGGEGLRLERR